MDEPQVWVLPCSPSTAEVEAAVWERVSVVREAAAEELREVPGAECVAEVLTFGGVAAALELESVDEMAGAVLD